MKRTRRTLLSLALCAAICLSLLPGTARAEDPGYSFDPDSGTLTVTTSGGTTAWKRKVNVDSITSLVVKEGVTEIRGEAFLTCYSLEQASLPDGLVNIYNYAFSNCTRLQLTELPDTVTSIGSSAFYNCPGLVLTELPSRLGRIENSAFRGCTGLRLTKLPDNVEFIGSYAFSGCAGLELTRLPDKVASIGEYAFDGYGGGDRQPHRAERGSVVFDGYDGRGCVFDGCAGLKLTELPDTLTSIGYYAFSGCAGLELTELPEALTSISENAFDGCTGLALTKLPSRLEVIDLEAFRGCTGLRLTEIPATVTEIWDGAFDGCSGLTSLTFSRATAPSLGSEAFKGIPDLILYVPNGADDYDKGGWTAYADRIVSGAALSGLTVSAGDLTPAFFPGRNDYRLSVANSVENVALTPTAHGSGTITVNDTAVASGAASGPIPLEAGKTTKIDIVVQNSPDDTRTYTVAVTRAAAVIDIPDVPGVTAPVRGAVPVTVAAETEQYTGTVAWTPDPGGAFAADTAYTAAITLTPKPGYTLAGVVENFFTVEGAAPVTNAAGSGVITAVFPGTAPAPSSGGASYSYYAVTPTAGEGGAIDPAEPVRVRQGKDQTFTITPAEGYTVADVLVDGESVGAVETYTFEKVKARHTIEAVFVPVWVNPFTDVAEDDWFYGPVAWAQGAGVMTGTAADTFEPEAPVTRAALVTALYRLAGKPQGGGEGGPFTDIPSGQWYSGAAAWAVDAGVTQGVGGGRFDPDGAVTREQLFTLLYRFALYQKRDVSMGEDTNILSYTDAMDLAEWAVPAFQWACGAGVTEGTQDGRLAPEEVATRAQLAAVLERYAGA